MNILNFMKRLPLFFYLLLIVVSVLFFGEMIPLYQKQVLLALSEMVKDALVFVLPVIIFSCLFSSMLAFADRALVFVAGLLLFICVSNYFTSILGFEIGVWASQFMTDMTQPSTTETLIPAWDLSMQGWIDNRYALGAGLFGGLMAASLRNPLIQRFADQLNASVHFFLKRIFLPVMPVFVLGFVVKMQHEGLLDQVFRTYLPILVMITLSFVVYVAFLFLAAARFRVKDAFIYARRALPAGIVGFSTMSSMAALPLNLTAAETSAANPGMARAVIPATANGHLIGDSLGVPIIAIAVLMTFDMPLPSLWTFSVFAMYLMLTKFSIVGVPAGGILVVLEPLGTYLGFSGEMSALLMAVYILFEPMVTFANVMGNNAIAILLSRCARE